MQTIGIEVVDMRKVSGGGNIKAFADVKIAGSLVVRGFSVVNGKNGIFVSMPSRPGKDGRWLEILTPLDPRLKQEFEDKVLEAYDEQASVKEG